MPQEAWIDTEHDERQVGAVTTSRHTGDCSICGFSFRRNVTPVVHTSWSRIVHPACLAPARARTRIAAC